MPIKTKSKSSPQTKRTFRVRLLVIITLLPVLISCGDFIDEEKTSPGTENHQPAPQTPVPASPKTPETPKHQGETDEQRNWRLCEEERKWAFTAKLIDTNELQLYQSRNFAPVFNRPGERQSGIEGWYQCANALKMNGFIQ